jgi:hypothetical protein
MKRKISGDRWMDGEMDEGKSMERDGWRQVDGEKNQR